MSRWLFIHKKGDNSSIICSYLMHFLIPSSKNKKNPSRKKFFIFREMELYSSKINNFFIFSQKNAFLIFRETETQKQNFVIFQETEILKNFLYFKK